MHKVTPEEVGFSSERLAMIQPAMQRYVDEGKLAGIITLIARHGKVAHAEKVGMQDSERNKPMAFDTIFRISFHVVNDKQNSPLTHNHRQIQCRYHCPIRVFFIEQCL